ncbi:MAG: hypothetical protein OXB92_05940 [Acidimicrobiaceae bacterium]|nr:hypothetical protein [Acidimicrobiaceae bacterium]
MTSPSRFWTDEQTLPVLDYLKLTDHLEAEHLAGNPLEIGDSFVVNKAGDGVLTRTALGATRSGVKIASVFPSNSGATVQSIYILFNRRGDPEFVMGADSLTCFKTACDSALASRHLSRTDAEHLLMVGAGSMAPHLIAAHRAVRPSIRRVSIWNRGAQRAQVLASQTHDASAVDVASLAEAVADADVISVATLSSEPLINGEWLPPGVQLDLVGAYRPDVREADDTALTTSRIFVDSRHTIDHEIGELAIPLAAGIITRDNIRGDLYELCQGRVTGRDSPATRTVFKNGGGGHLDLMTATFIANRLEPDETT